MMNFSREGTAELIDDPWASEIDNAPAPRFPGLATGDAAASTGCSPLTTGPGGARSPPIRTP